MVLANARLTIKPKNQYFVSFLCNFQKSENERKQIPRMVPQAAGHRCEVGLGPMGSYRALPIGPYKALYRTLYRALFGCPIFPLWAASQSSRCHIKDDNFLTPPFFMSSRRAPLMFFSTKSVLGPLDLF